MVLVADENMRAQQIFDYSIVMKCAKRPSGEECFFMSVARMDDVRRTLFDCDQDVVLLLSSSDKRRV